MLKIVGAMFCLGGGALGIDSQLYNSDTLL